MIFIKITFREMLFKYENIVEKLVLERMTRNIHPFGLLGLRTTPNLYGLQNKIIMYSWLEEAECKSCFFQFILN